MISISVKADIRKAQLFLKATEQGTKRATSRALNRAAVSTRTEAVRLLRERRNLPAKVIRDAMRITNSTTQNLVAIVTASGRPIEIRHFGLRGSKRNGLSVQVTRNGPRVRLQHSGRKAFRHPALGGGLPVFVRVGKRRLPIKRWAPVPGLPTVFVQAEIAEALKRVATATFRKRFAHEMQREIERARK